MIPFADSGSIEKLVPPSRLIGCYTSGRPGPLIVAVGAIHGNEPSGPSAIETVVEKLAQQQPPISGAFVGLVGNIKAFKQKRRFIDEDLNRCFRPARVANIGKSEVRSAEQAELEELVGTIDALAEGAEDVCFLDCHTTSSETIPYISVNAHPDSLLLTSRFPLYSVVGLEDSIPGCFGEFCNKRDYRGFTFEAGQHDDSASVECQEAALRLLLVFSGALLKRDIDDYEHYEQMLARHIVEGKRAFRLVAHYRISAGEQFEMCPGFVNFSRIHKGQLLARNRFGDIDSPSDGRILMPLYQKEGDDGFFVLEEEDKTLP